MAEPFTTEDCIDRAHHLIGVHASTLQKAADEYPDKVDVIQLDANIRKLLDISHKLKQRNPTWPIPVLRGPMGRITNASA